MNNNYKIILQEKLDTFDSHGTMYEHIKTKARICHLANDDDNKVFYIAFRTPPKDSTGVAHIIEHTVLCGSTKYPVKDPFIELAKGSLNTFLNAMTYPDKTVYPIASTNEKDFFNLMDVYLDAVFHPNIYKYREIFEQEGWHYELESEEDALTINGVVYNEMKGAFSSPDEVLGRQILNSLFPDTTYAIESGGDPKDIPSLTYEAYLDFHKKYYHPSNSYIYVYGDVDIEKVLEYLDKEYLSKYDYQEVDSSIALQKPFAEKRDIEIEYPISSEQDEEDSTYLAYSVCIGDVLDTTLYQAYSILDYALVTSPGAPVYQALIDAGICEDVESIFDFSLRQMYYSIIAKGANKSDKEAFEKIITETLEKIVKEGVIEKTLLAAINAEQFRILECDFGSFPKGLVIGLQMMDSWLYDSQKPFVQLHGFEELDKIKSRVNKCYFEGLIENTLLNNSHKSFIMMTPKKGLATEFDEQLAKKLKTYKESLSKDEILSIVQHTRELKEYQSTPSNKEDLEKIPLLARGDLNPNARKIDLEVVEESETTYLFHEVPTGGIHYLTMLFDVSEANEEELYYLALVERFIGLVNTQKYSFNDFSDEVNLHTGGVTTNLIVHPVKDFDEYKLTFEVRCKFLKPEEQKLVEILEQMLLHSDFSDVKRLKELIVAEKSHIETSMHQRGNLLASIKVRSAFSKKAYLTDLISGLSFYRFLEKLENDFDDKSQEVISRINKTVSKLFTASRLIVSSTGDKECFEQAKRITKMLVPQLFHEDSFNGPFAFSDTQVKAAYKDASQIQYVAMGGSFLKAGQKYDPNLKILNTILGYDYFWNNVRVLGGAYGCNYLCDREGEMAFVSYRDPKLLETIEVFRNTSSYLKSFDVDERDMTKYIIGTIGSMDVPLTPLQRGRRGVNFYFAEVGFEQIQAERQSVINATAADIRALAPIVESVIAQDNIVVVGNEDKISQNSDVFTTIESLN